MKKTIALFLVLIFVLSSAMFVFTSCNNVDDGIITDTGEAQTVKLKVWGADKDQDMLKEMCNAFAAANSDKKYEFEYAIVGEGDAKKTILDDPDAAADVFSFSNDQLADLVAAGALAQIGGTYKTTAEADNTETSYDAAVIDGKLYAFPETADNGYFLYYDKSVLETPPISLSEILVATTSSKKFAMNVSNSWYNAAFFLGAGCTFSDDQKIDFNNAKGLNAAKSINELVKNSGFVNFTNETYDPSILSGFADKTIIAAVSGTWNAEAIKEALGDNYAACKLPTFTVDGVEVQMSGFAGFKLVGVNSNSAYLTEAIKLGAWLTNEENQLKRFEDRAMGPSNKVAAQDDKVKANIALAALAEQLQYSISQKNVPGSFWNAAEGFGTDLVAGTVEDSALQDMLDNVVEAVNNPVS